MDFLAVLDCVYAQQVIPGTFKGENKASVCGKMSFEGTRRRCIIQKLDFENCIVTNLKTTARGRKKLRARITREFQQADIPEEESTSIENPRSSSPVLLKKQSRNVVNLKRKKISPPEWSGVGGPPTPCSPVFRTHKKPKTGDSSQELSNVMGRLTTLDAKNSQGNSSSDLPSSFQIEEFTQESKQSVKISSVESPTPKTDTSSVHSAETHCHPRFTPPMICESPKPIRKNYKKKSLLGRLQKLQKKQASEKLLFQHQNRKSWGSSMRVTVDSFWVEEFSYFFKCRSNVPNIEAIYIMIDSRWVPNVRNLKEGSVMELYPPWQKLFEGSTMTVLNVICLDVLEETEEPVRQERTFEEVPPEQFEIDQKLFIDSLFSSWSSGFLV